MRLTRISVRLLPCAAFVGNPARLHLNRENAVTGVKDEKVRLPLRRRPNTIAEPAVGVKHRIVVPEHLERMIRQPLSLAPVEIPYKCGIESCHRCPPRFYISISKSYRSPSDVYIIHHFRGICSVIAEMKTFPMRHSLYTIAFAGSNSFNVLSIDCASSSSTSRMF